ncbi:MAG: hypothetical protein ABWY54_07680, partial [Glaciihabitans sp.]
MKNKIATLVMAALLLLYLVLVGRYAVLLILSESPTAKVMGVALAVLPILGVWALVAELLFVVRAEKLVAILAERGELPVDDLPRLPSGRPDRVAADTQFPIYQQLAEERPHEWKSWLLLGLAYDASGDRKRARWATRRAIRL